MTSPSMGDRFKGYEQAFQHTLPRRTYTIMCLDGRSFNPFMRGKDLPEQRFMHVMDLTAEALCEEISGSVFSYTQSDEISILLQDFANHNTQPWFGGNIQKMVSVAAGIASHHFHAVYGAPGGTLEHTFDARVFTLTDPVEVANYFVWRQKDAYRNAISSLAHRHFGHGEIIGLSTAERRSLLEQDHLLDEENFFIRRFLHGRLTCYEEKEVSEFGGTWHRWYTDIAPKLTATADGALVRLIPPLPSLEG